MTVRIGSPSPPPPPPAVPPALDETSRFDVESRASMIRSKKIKRSRLVSSSPGFLELSLSNLIYLCIIITELYGNVKTLTFIEIEIKKKKARIVFRFLGL